MHSLSPALVELAMVLRTRYCNANELPDRYHECVAVVENPKDRYVTPITSIKGVVDLVPEEEDDEWTGHSKHSKVFQINNLIDLDTYYSVY